MYEFTLRLLHLYYKSKYLEYLTQNEYNDSYMPHMIKVTSMTDMDDVINLNQVLYAKSVSKHINHSSWNIIRNYDV